LASEWWREGDPELMAVGEKWNPLRNAGIHWRTILAEKAIGGEVFHGGSPEMTELSWWR
jgi:hypothetical protein